METKMGDVAAYRRQIVAAAFEGVEENILPPALRLDVSWSPQDLTGDAAYATATVGALKIVIDFAVPGRVRYDVSGRAAHITQDYPFDQTSLARMVVQVSHAFGRFDWHTGYVVPETA
jgi:hypothetical protein